MSPDELETVLLENPNSPHRLTLSSGDSIIIPNARVAVITGIGMRIFEYAGSDRLIAKSSRFVSVPNIVLVELLAPSGNGSTRHET